MLSKHRKQTERKAGRPAGRAKREPSRVLERLRSPLARRAVWVAGIAAGCLAVYVGLCAMELWVLTHQAPAPRSLRLSLVGAPPWMPRSLRRSIVSDLAPPRQGTYDDLLARKISQRARKNPWIRAVHKVRRRPGPNPDEAVVELHARYRKAVARIRLGRQFAYVADDGVRVPAEQTPLWVGRLRGAGAAPRQVCFQRAKEVPPGVHVRQIHYFRIDGIRGAAPEIGQPWPGEDMAEAMKLIALIVRKPYANQITIVDVRNHRWRISQEEPCLRMYAQIPNVPPTDIRFGRFAEAGGDFNVPADRKIAYLDQYTATHGVLAGQCKYIDLQYDELHVSAP